jgi:hypothetical protein
MCSATSEEEHAVSTETAGPSNPKVYATRPETTLPMFPVNMYPSRPFPLPRAEEIPAP